MKSQLYRRLFGNEMFTKKNLHTLLKKDSGVTFPLTRWERQNSAYAL